MPTTLRGTAFTRVRESVKVSPPPDVGASASFTVDSSGDPTIAVDGSSSSGNSPLSFNWEWGDGSPDDSGETASNNYQQNDNYTIKLTITDADGDTDTATQTVTVSNADQDVTTGFTMSP